MAAVADDDAPLQAEGPRAVLELVVINARGEEVGAGVFQDAGDQERGFSGYGK